MSKTMELEDAIKTRRTIRSYTNKEISKETLEKLFDAARWAPTACNRQGLRFIILGKEAIEKLVYAGTAWFVPEAPTTILVLYENRSDNAEYDDHILSGAAAVQNFMLKAWELDIGVAWVNNLPPKNKLKRIFKIPWNYDPICLLTLGYFEKKPGPLPRRTDLKDIYCNDYFQLREKRQSRFSMENLNLLGKRILRTCYNHTPLFLKQYLKPIAYKHERKFYKHL